MLAEEGHLSQYSKTSFLSCGTKAMWPLAGVDRSWARKRGWMGGGMGRRLNRGVEYSRRLKSGCRRWEPEDRSSGEDCLAATWQERQDLPQTSRNLTPPPRLATPQKNESAPATPTTTTGPLQNCPEPMSRLTPVSPAPLTLIWMTLTPHPFSTFSRRTLALHLRFSRLCSHIPQCRFSGPARPRLPASIPCADPGFLFTARIAEATRAASTLGFTGIFSSFSQPHCLPRLNCRVPSRTYSPFPCLTLVLVRRTPQFSSIAFVKTHSRSLTKLLAMLFAFL